METSINGKPAEWSEEIRAKWIEAFNGCHYPQLDKGTVERANYFTPRPYVDEYNRGSVQEGFTYTFRPFTSAGVPEVWQAIIHQIDRPVGTPA